MIQRGDRLRLTMKARDTIRIAALHLRQHFDGDETIEPGVAGPIHFAHAAGAEQADNLVGAE